MTTNRRHFLTRMVAFSTALSAAPAFSQAAARPSAGRTITGKLSGKSVFIPDLDTPPMPQLADSGVIRDGQSIRGFRAIDPAIGYPDVLSFRRKLALLIPATNTSMEAELWDILIRHRTSAGLDGIGLHTSNVITPKPVLRNAADLQEYKRQFLGGLKTAVEQAMLAQPHYFIMGMSLEHIIDTLDEIRAPIAELEAQTGLGCAAWHDAAVAALSQFKAKRIGLLTPFDANGNRNAARIFTALGFDVVSTVGFACANALHIAHIPDAAKERAIVDHLATNANRLDAIVQCGTNMSLTQVTERLEPRLGLPIIGINAALLWYALRENGFAKPMHGAGRLFAEL